MILRAASNFSESERSTYEIDRLHPTVEAWTAEDSLIDALDFLYSTTERLIAHRTRTIGSVVDVMPSAASDRNTLVSQTVQARLKQQMADLAAALCTNMEDKIRTFKTCEYALFLFLSTDLAAEGRWTVDLIHTRV